MDNLSDPYKVLPLKGIRRIIGRRMLESVTQKPHVTLHAQAKAAGLVRARTQWADQVKAATGANLTATAVLVKLVGLSLCHHPRLNGRLEESELRLYRFINIGVAVALDDGLIVPVVRNADQKSLAIIAAEIEEFAGRARIGKLKPQELMDGTFTVSTLGAFGVTYFTPIINPPELAILGVGKMESRLALAEGQVVEEPFISLSLSFDHAALDGVPAARFLKELADSIEGADRILAASEKGGERV